MTRRQRALRARLRDERGTALVMAIGISMVLAIAGASLILYGTSNQNAANRSRATHDAYQLAVSGVESAASQIANADPTLRSDYQLFTSLGPTAKQEAFDAGETVTWDGVLWDDNPNNGVNPGGSTPYTGPASPSLGYFPILRWRLTSSAVTPNPNGPGTISRTVTADVRLTPETTQDVNTDAWKYIYSKEANDPDGCDLELPNNPSVQSSFYVSGTLCLDNNSSIVGPTAGNPPVEVIVRENILLKKNGNDVGTSSRPLTSLAVEGQATTDPDGSPSPQGGCSWKGDDYHKPCTSADHTLPNSVSNTPAVPGPVADFTSWFQAASPGPRQPCDATRSSGNYTFLVDDGVLNGSQGTLNLAQSTSYSCETLTGQLTWDAAARKLKVAGTMFFDGNIDFSSAGTIEYDGSAAIYLSGWFHMRQTVLCAILSGSNCNASAWQSNPSDVLLVSANGNNNFGPSCPGCSALLEQSAEMQGALYGEFDLGFQNNSFIQGPMVSNREIIQNSFTFNYIPPLIQVPFGTPGNVVTEWRVLPPENYTG